MVKKKPQYQNHYINSYDSFPFNRIAECLTIESESMRKNLNFHAIDAETYIFSMPDMSYYGHALAQKIQQEVAAKLQHTLGNIFGRG